MLILCCRELINLFFTLLLRIGCCDCLNCEGCGFLALEFWTRKGISEMVFLIETGGFFLAMNWLLKNVEFHLSWSCLVENGLSYGLDDWRRKVIVTAMVLIIKEDGLDNWRSMVSSLMVVNGWLNSEEVKCWW